MRYRPLYLYLSPRYVKGISWNDIYSARISTVGTSYGVLRALLGMLLGPNLVLGLVETVVRQDKHHGGC